MSARMPGNLEEFRRDGSHRSPFTTRAQESFRGGDRKRMLWAVLLGLVIMLAILLLGPDPDAIIDRLEHYGAPGELQIMPEISIEDGRDRAHQLPKSLQAPPPPSKMEIEKEETSETGTEPVPKETDPSEVMVQTDVQVVDPDSEVAQNEQVELSLPMQSNPDWYILHQVRPEYPLDAPESERQIPVIFVKVAVFVGPAGDVVEAMITTTNGSRVFADEVLEKVQQWKFGWRVAPGAGRWIEMTWNFNSPYFTRRNGQG